jgi:PAS domain S-box-containing protein
MTYIVVLAGFCLLSAFITCGLGFFVYAQKPESTVHRLFLALMLAATYWALGEYLIWQAGTYDGVLFWLKASSFWPLIIALTAHFILVFTGTALPRGVHRTFLLAALYLSAVAFALIEIFTDWIYVVAYEPGTGYVYLPVQAHPVFLIETVCVILVMLLASYASFVSWRQATRERIHRQNRLVCVGISTVILFGALSGAILPIYGIHTPNLVFIGLVVFSLLIAHAIRRYGLFTLSPETAVPEILRTMPDGLVLADQDGRVVAVNESASEIFGVAEAGLVGRSVGSLIQDETYISIGQALAGKGRVSDVEVRIGQESPRFVSIAGSTVRDRDGEPAGIVLIVRDITGRKASETALRVANEKISMLSRLTRHDIGNLVTALSGYLSFLEEDRTGPNSGRYLSRSIDIVGKIIRHLQFSREYQEIGSSMPVWQPLGPMIDRAAEGLPRDGVRIEVQVARLEIYADPLSVKAVYNLMENAIRHGKTLTRVVIATEEQADGTLVLVFEDDGVGIRDEDKEQIFRYGYGENTGFGLAFSREILSVTGIGIAETGTFGKGARFEIRVPREAWRRSE